MKYVFDFLFSFFAIILLAPVLAILSLLMLMTQGSPILFCQKRLGLAGKKFTLYKFRTMKVGPSISSIDDENRLTKIGRFLRKTSLDELPTFFNVLLGDMSIVGPRPLLVKYSERYTSFQARRHEVKPGITGLAQVKGRNALSWKNKFRYDIFYVDKHNILFDIRIIFFTIFIVFMKKGVSPIQNEITPEFKID